jgi:hypothetical protein
VPRPVAHAALDTAQARAPRDRTGRMAVEGLVAAVGPDPAALGQRPAVGGPVLGNNRLAGGDRQQCDQQNLTNPPHVSALTALLLDSLPLINSQPMVFVSGPFPR